MRKHLLSLLALIPSLGICQNNNIILNHTQCRDAVIDLANGVGTLNWGSMEETGIYAWTSGGNPVTGRTLIWFDLSIFNPSSQAASNPNRIKKAILHLYTPDTPGFVPQGNQGVNAFQLFRVTSPWDESTVTWNTAPSYDAATSVNHDVVSTQSNIEITMDVTSLVKVMAMNTANNYGMYIRIANETPYRSVALASREHSNPANRPWLEIEMEPNATGMAEVAFSGFTTYQTGQGTLHCAFTPSQSGVATLTLYTINGQQLLEQHVSVTQGSAWHNEWNTGNLAPGVYLMRVVQNNSARNLKFVVSN